MVASVAEATEAEAEVDVDVDVHGKCAVEETANPPSSRSSTAGAGASGVLRGPSCCGKDGGSTPGGTVLITAMVVGVVKVEVSVATCSSSPTDNVKGLANTTGAALSSMGIKLVMASIFGEVIVGPMWPHRPAQKIQPAFDKGTWDGLWGPSD